MPEIKKKIQELVLFFFFGKYYRGGNFHSQSEWKTLRMLSNTRLEAIHLTTHRALKSVHYN
jgi:hypothetical protein